MSFTKEKPRSGVLLFLPLALAFGCVSPTLKQEQVVCVTLQNGKPTPDIDPVKLSKEQGHVAHWVFCGMGELKITMKKENPFAKPFEEGGKHVRSGKLRADASYGKYGYTITVKTGEGTFHNDPDVDVER